MRLCMMHFVWTSPTVTIDTNLTKWFHFETPKIQFSHVPRKKTEASRDLTVSIHAMLSLANTGANLLVVAVLVPSLLVAQHGLPHFLAHLLLHLWRASPRRTPAIRLLVRRALKAGARPLSPKIHTHICSYLYRLRFKSSQTFQQNKQNRSEFTSIEGNVKLYSNSFLFIFLKN